MKYERKTTDRWDIESNYGYGWEVEDSCYSLKEAKINYQLYLENGTGMYRLIKRRERKEI